MRPCARSPRSDLLIVYAGRPVRTSSREGLADSGDETVLATGPTPVPVSGCPACRHTLAGETGGVDVFVAGRDNAAGLWVGRCCRSEQTPPIAMAGLSSGIPGTW